MMWNSNGATPKLIFFEGAIRKIHIINNINIYVILRHWIFIVTCLISRHSRQNFIEIYSFFFSERSFTHATGAWCHSSSFRPWVLHKTYKNPQMCQKKHVPWLLYDIYTGLTQYQTNCFTQTRVLFDHPNFIGVINIDTSSVLNSDMILLIPLN